MKDLRENFANFAFNLIPFNHPIISIIDTQITPQGTISLKRQVVQEPWCRRVGHDQAELKCAGQIYNQRPVSLNKAVGADTLTVRPGRG